MISDPLPTASRVITEAEAARMVGLSVPTLRRMRYDEKRENRGPRHVRLSERRIGYRLFDLDAWLERRVSGGERRSTPA